MMTSFKSKSPQDSQPPAAGMATGVFYSFLLRILSFVLTQATLRFADVHTLGKASIRLELICSTTVLFLGREGFRLGLVRVAGGTNTHEQQNNLGNLVGQADGDARDGRLKALQVNNVAWLSIPTALCLTLIALIYHLCTYEEQVHVESGFLEELEDYKLAGILYCIATSIEIMSEPCMIICLRTMDVKTRAKAEGLASIGKALSCVLLLSFAGDRYRVSSFGFAQCIYAILVTMVLYLDKGNSLQKPSPVKNGECDKLVTIVKQSFDASALRLSTFFSLQSIFKHILTEGDRIVLTALAGAYDSGVYAMASSYGGMASRLIFQPLEENGRLLFSHQHVSIVEARQRGKSASELIQKMEMTYCLMVKCVLYIGLIFAVFGSNFTSILLKILAGDRWGSNPDAAAALSVFCIYLSIMSLNGMTEAFVYGVAESGKEVVTLSISHGTIGLVFYIIAPLMVIHGTDYGVGGTIGLVLSNGVCMALRTVYSFLFAGSYFRKYQDADVKGKISNFIPLFKKSAHLFMKTLPESPILFWFCLSFAIMKRSKERMSKDSSLFSVETASHLGVGISCFVATSVLTFLYERKNFGQSVQELLSRRGDKDKVN